MKKFALLICLLFISIACIAQDTITKNGLNTFYYSSGKISSEGFMKEGKPNGYWKTFYENGQVKSEGNRKDFLLDSTWKFYSDSGRLNLSINYDKGKKNGFRITYLKTETIEEFFKNDVKDSMSFHLYPNGAIKSKVNFVYGREEGLGIEYAPDGTIITLIDYKRGYVINTEKINRVREDLKHGVWKEFYKNEKVKSEGVYNYGRKDGYFKAYDKDGNLTSIEKYENDILIEDAPELASLKVKTDYYRNGKLRIVQSYKDNIPEGVRREYSPEGQIVKSYIYKNGIIIGEGIVDEKGLHQGIWKEFYETGEKEAEGEYKNSLHFGAWKFFYKNGLIAQTGNYASNGKPDGKWKWYYESGNLRKEDNFTKGVLNGYYKEVTDSGKIIIEGNYIEGKQDGQWIYEVGDEKEVGSYLEGNREGNWKHFFADGKLNFECNYTEGNLDGEYITYWDNGKIREKGKYVMGQKEGDWFVNDYDGLRIISIRYEDGIEISYDGNKIE
ncbi:MAG: toxin-antitoxin system YwqK family antitoxin [Bacteroidota bacterium]